MKLKKNVKAEVLLKAYKYILAKDYKSALDHFSLALKSQKLIKQQRAHIFEDMGWCYFHLGNYLQMKQNLVWAQKADKSWINADRGLLHQLYLTVLQEYDRLPGVIGDRYEGIRNKVQFLVKTVIKLCPKSYQADQLQKRLSLLIQDDKLRTRPPKIYPVKLSTTCLWLFGKHMNLRPKQVLLLHFICKHEMSMKRIDVEEQLWSMEGKTENILSIYKSQIIKKLMGQLAKVSKPNRLAAIDIIKRIILIARSGRVSCGLRKDEIYLLK